MVHDQPFGISQRQALCMITNLLTFSEISLKPPLPGRMKTFHNLILTNISWGFVIFFPDRPYHPFTWQLIKNKLNCTAVLYLVMLIYTSKDDFWVLFLFIPELPPNQPLDLLQHRLSVTFPAHISALLWPTVTHCFIQRESLWCNLWQTPPPELINKFSVMLAQLNFLQIGKHTQQHLPDRASAVCTPRALPWTQREQGKGRVRHTQSTGQRVLCQGQGVALLEAT